MSVFLLTCRCRACKGARKEAFWFGVWACISAGLVCLTYMVRP